MDEWERDCHQEYKDDLAMGYIDRDGNQLDPEPPDDHGEEPVDLDEAKALHGESIGFNAASDRLLQEFVPRMIGEIAVLRAEVARFVALETRQEYAVTPGQTPDEPGLVWLFDRPEAAYAWADRNESGPEAKVWVRPLTCHPWTEIVTKAPF